MYRIRAHNAEYEFVWRYFSMEVNSDRVLMNTYTYAGICAYALKHVDGFVISIFGTDFRPAETTAGAPRAS
jgi:hypothetical protein